MNIVRMKHIMIKVAAWGVLPLVLLAMPKEAHVSQIVLNSVSLDEVLRDTSCVIVAKKAEPFIKTEEIIITPPGAANSNKYPPFLQTTYRFIVLEVLSAKMTISAGQVIEAVSPSQKHLFVMHKTYYLGQPVPSASMPKYQDSFELDKMDKFILYLAASDKSGFEFTVENAFDSILKMEDIVIMLNAMKR